MSNADYKTKIASAPVVLVEFYASWCPHCQRMMPIVAEVKEDLKGKVEVLQYDIDENKQLAEAEGVETIPTFIVYRDGKEEMRQSGEMTREELLQFAKQYVNLG